MILTIDTTHALNDTDRALLRALLDAGNTAPPPAHGTPGTPRRAQDLAAGVIAAAGRPGGSPLAAAKGPVASQPGVRFTESTSEDTDPGA